MDGVVERGVKRRRHLGEQGWRELFERFEGAGLSVEAFCRREGLCRSSFIRWRGRLRAGALPAASPRQVAKHEVSPAFVDLGMLGAVADATAGGSASGLELRIELGGGVTLTLSRR